LTNINVPLFFYASLVEKERLHLLSPSILERLCASSSLSMLGGRRRVSEGGGQIVLLRGQTPQTSTLEAFIPMSPSFFDDAPGLKM